MNKPLVALALALSFSMPAMGQAAPRPTPEQLAKTYEEDQLSLEKCGVPRNAADDYRPAPLTPDQTRAPRIKSSQSFKVDVVASGLPNAWGIDFLPSGDITHISFIFNILLTNPLRPIRHGTARALTCCDETQGRR